MNWARTVILAEEQARIIADAVAEQRKSEFTKTNRSTAIAIDLTVVHNEESLNLDNEITYLWATIEAMAAPMTFRLRALDNSLSGIFTGFIGASISQHEFKDILISNPVGVGVAVIQVGWRE